MGNALEKVIDHAPVAVTMTPMDMLNQAVERGADIGILTQLMNLQERWEKNQARKAFDKAISAAKAELSPIVRNAKGHNDKRYADFAAIARAVDPVISKFGLSYRFRTTQNDRINVTCILSHEDGHSEETTLGGPADTSGSKNAIQAIGSTLTYLQRYSLTQALGLAASNDDDGRTSEAKVDDTPITKVQVSVIRELIESAQIELGQFCDHWKIEAIADIPAAKFNEVVSSLRRRVEFLKNGGKSNG